MDNEKKIISASFYGVMDLVSYAAKHTEAVRYLLKKKQTGEMVLRHELLNSLEWAPETGRLQDIAVPLPQDTYLELTRRKERVLAALRYLNHGKNGAYIDTDALYCIFGLEPSEIPKDTDFLD